MQEIQSIEVDELLRKASKNTLCKCFDSKVCSVKSTYLEEMDAVFEEINDIHVNRHRYDLHWAFDDAQSKLKHFTAELWKNHIALQEKELEERAVLSEDLQKLNLLNQQMEQKLKRKFKWYSYLSNLVTVAEMGISVLAVIGLSHLSHSGESLIHSAYLSMVFVGIMAFFKVVLERYWIKPQIDKWGWSLYLQASSRMREMITLLLGATVAIRDVLQNQPSSEYDVEIMNAMHFNQNSLRMENPISPAGLRVSIE